MRFECHDGSVIERGWKFNEPFPELLNLPPSWLENGRRSWDHPQDPIMFTGTVAAGREAEARKVVGV